MKSKFLTTAFIALYSITLVYGQQTVKKILKDSAQAAQQQTEIYKAIFKADSQLFNAFNNCDSTTYKRALTADFEFYHDQGGLHYLNEELLSFKEMCNRNSHIRRELLKETLEVYKIGENDALEIGVHRFFHTNKGETEHLSGIYKFIQIWQKEEGTWKLKRVISYGHDKMNNN
ncbi:nuclear transport factor 2 family protein [Mucilaginibacter xinganensis]|uniref:DUF4440 domain-containing protein n=1 Tax=Mucilaginibacter xinganensis TaxID=1234841 RepID=A0A223NS10_9SPHI|nr:nuclear transport factor 2 family protein [Mucilaginibacter xinganensis]ASU32606.1 hypothetical protein MuYL_0703 [Mucilaginibacter xinganensis]